jgi:hypothetical protein
MKLDAWLRQDHPLAERLLLVERLSQALNAVHDRGEVLVALEPARVEVAGDLRCDLSAAERGSPEPGYAAPERIEGGPPSPEADVYSAGAIAWEAVGRPCGEMPPFSPTSHRTCRASLSASAMLGARPWRLKDLTYLARLRPRTRRPCGDVEPRCGGASARARRPRAAHSATNCATRCAEAILPQPPATADRGGAGARRRGSQLLVDPAAGTRRRAPERRGARAHPGRGDAQCDPDSRTDGHARGRADTDRNPGHADAACGPDAASDSECLAHAGGAAHADATAHRPRRPRRSPWRRPSLRPRRPWRPRPPRPRPQPRRPRRAGRAHRSLSLSVRRPGGPCSICAAPGSGPT